MTTMMTYSANFDFSDLLEVSHVQTSHVSVAFVEYNKSQEEVNTVRDRARTRIFVDWLLWGGRMATHFFEDSVALKRFIEAHMKQLTKDQAIYYLEKLLHTWKHARCAESNRAVGGKVAVSRKSDGDVLFDASFKQGEILLNSAKRSMTGPQGPQDWYTEFLTESIVAFRDAYVHWTQLWLRNIEQLFHLSTDSTRVDDTSARHLIRGELQNEVETPYVAGEEKDDGTQKKNETPCVTDDGIQEKIDNNATDVVMQLCESEGIGGTGTSCTRSEAFPYSWCSAIHDELKKHADRLEVVRSSNVFESCSVKLTVRNRSCLSPSQERRELPGLAFFIRKLEATLRELVAQKVYYDPFIEDIGQLDDCTTENIVQLHKDACSKSDDQMQKFFKAYPELHGERAAWTKVIRQFQWLYNVH